MVETMINSTNKQQYQTKIKTVIFFFFFKRCRADVEAGAFLSGGIDKSTLQLKLYIKNICLILINDEDLKRARIYSKY